MTLEEGVTPISLKCVRRAIFIIAINMKKPNIPNKEFIRDGFIVYLQFITKQK